MTEILLAVAALFGLGSIALVILAVVGRTHAIERARRAADEEWIEGGFAAEFERREREREAGL